MYILHQLEQAQAIDWSWFFSTISQSAAAFIAITFTYIVFQWSKYSTDLADNFKEFDELSLAYRRLLDIFDEYRINLFNRYILFSSMSFYKFLDDEEFNKSDDDAINKKLLETFIRIPKHMDILTAYNSYKKDFYPEPNGNKKDNFAYELNMLETRFSADGHNEIKFEAVVKIFKENQIQLFNTYDRFKKLKSKTKALITNYNLIRSLLLVLSLGSLFLIILPLLFLPFDSSSDNICISFNLFDFSKITSFKNIFIILFFAFILAFNSILFRSINRQKNRIIRFMHMLETNKYEELVLKLWPHEFLHTGSAKEGRKLEPTFRF